MGEAASIKSDISFLELQSVIVRFARTSSALVLRDSFPWLFAINTAIFSTPEI